MTFKAFSKYAAAALVFSMALITSADSAEAKRPKVGFLSSIEIPEGPEMRVVTVDGEEFVGYITSSGATQGSMTRFKFRTFDGRKIKFKAQDVALLEIVVDEALQDLMIDNATDTVEEIWKADFERIFEVETLEFHAIRHPWAKRVALRQLINPGFDSRIQVYYLPKSKEGKSSSGIIPLFGDMAKAYLVVKDGAEPIRVKQWQYSGKFFEQLFGDCPALTERYTGNMRKFKFFAEHTQMYDQLCPGEGSPTYDENSAEAMTR